MRRSKEDMYLIVGLGNPGEKYENTRHNAGAMAVDRLSSLLGARIRENRFRALCGKASYEGEKLLIIKPQTYMNASGESVRAAAEYYKIGPDHIIIVYDDVNFECGRLRVRGQGSAGGHNGMKSVIACLGTDAFPRVRIGIGSPQEEGGLIDHVLGRFPKADMEKMDRSLEAAARAALCIVDDGLLRAMDRFNGLDLSKPGEMT